MPTVQSKHRGSQPPPKTSKKTSQLHSPGRDDLRQDSLTWRKQSAAYLSAAGLFHQSDELESCSDPDRAWQALVCGADQAHYHAVIVPTCKLAFCPMCAHARSVELARQYTSIVQDALNLSPNTHRLRHIVLTTPYEITHSKINSLVGSIWKKSIKCLEFVFGLKQRDWKKNNIGVLGGWEFGEAGHKLHIHLLVLSEWIDWEALVDAWVTVTDGICQVAHIKGVKDLEHGVREVTKYATKLTSMPPSLVPVLHKLLTGKRRVRAFGVFFGKIDEVEQLPQVCPVCQEKLIVVALLNLRPGNNFANDFVIKSVKSSNLSGIPPPQQLKLIPTHDPVFD